MRQTPTNSVPSKLVPNDVPVADVDDVKVEVLSNQVLTVQDGPHGKYPKLHRNDTEVSIVSVQTVKLERTPAHVHGVNSSIEA